MMYGIWQNVSVLAIYNTAFRKNVEALAHKKECEIVSEWIKSMVNHLYWSATSTKDGDGELILAKWLSLVNHIHNVHSGHGELFPECAHPSIYSHKKKWPKERKYHFGTYSRLVKFVRLLTTCVMYRLTVLYMYISSLL